MCLHNCAGIFIERTFNLETRAIKVNGKHTCIIKYFIGINQVRSVTFLLENWCDRVSDKEITIESNFLTS